MSATTKTVILIAIIIIVIIGVVGILSKDDKTVPSEQPITYEWDIRLDSLRNQKDIDIQLWDKTRKEFEEKYFKIDYFGGEMILFVNEDTTNFSWEPNNTMRLKTNSRTINQLVFCKKHVAIGKYFIENNRICFKGEIYSSRNLENCPESSLYKQD